MDFLFKTCVFSDGENDLFKRQLRVGVGQKEQQTCCMPTKWITFRILMPLSCINICNILIPTNKRGIENCTNKKWRLNKAQQRWIIMKYKLTANCHQEIRLQLGISLSPIRFDDGRSTNHTMLKDRNRWWKFYNHTFGIVSVKELSLYSILENCIRKSFFGVTQFL